MYGCYVFESGHGTRFADPGTLACRGLISATATSSRCALLGAVADAGAFLAQKSCPTVRIKCPGTNGI
jgi:hypothetical protein